MPGFDALAPDQKAVLQLLLKQGKSYDDIAGLLRLERSSVRGRALDALDALGVDEPGELSRERQDEVADHLLLQQTDGERDSTHRFLEGSAPGRQWAHSVAAALQPVARVALPDIPGEPAVSVARRGSERTATREPQRTSSRLGGVLILLAVAAVVGLGILLLVRGGDDAPVTAAAPAAASEATGVTGAAGGGLPQQQINLAPPEGSRSKALAFAVLAQGGLALQAQGLPASNRYGVWLFTSRSEALALGFAAYDSKTKRLAGAIQQLPEEAAGYEAVVITRQPDGQLTSPGPIVLRGPIRRQ